MANVLDILVRVNGTSQARAAIKSITGVAQELGLMIGLGGATAGLIAFGKQSFIMAGQAERLGRATDNLAKSIGASGDAMVKSITGASQNTISGVDAMRMANKAMLLDVVKNEKEMADLAGIAIVLGQAMGKDAASSVDDLTTALGRQSPLILDNLGIKMNLTEAEGRYAQMLGKTVNQLTDAEKKQAFMNAAWEKAREKAEQLGGVSLDSIGEVEQLTAAWADFQTEFGAFLTDSGVIPQITKLVLELKEGAVAWQGVFDRGQAGAESKKVQNLAMASTYMALLDPGAIVGGMIAGQSLGESIGASAERKAKFLTDTGIVKFDTDALQEEIAAVEKAQEGQASTAADVVEVADSAAKAQYDYAGALKAAGDLANSISDMDKEYASNRATSIQAYNKQRGGMDASFARIQSDQLANYQRQQERQMRDFLKSQIDAETNYNAQRMQVARSYGIETERAENEHQKRMARMREDYQMRQEDALAARDATSFLRNARDYEVSRRRAENDFGDQRSQRQADYEQQMADMQQSFAQQREQRLVQFQQQQTDAQSDFDYRQAQAVEQHTLEMQQLSADHQERLGELQTRLDEEKATEKAAFQSRLTEMEGFNAEFLALERQRNAAAKKILDDALLDMRQQNAHATYQPVHGRASGGYAGYGVYRLGEAGREFVLNAAATRGAEGLSGGRLSQDGVLAMLAAGRGAMNSFSQTVNIGGQESYAGLLAAIRTQTVGLLNEYARG